MKKVILVGAAALALWFIFKPKSTTDEVQGNSKPDLVDPNDGFAVVNSIGNFFLLKDGYAYYVYSLKVWQEYLAKYPQFTNNIVLTDEQLAKYPVNGSLEAGLIFNKL